jgi:GNAT superfamily N-acetyltransferase
MIHLSPSISLKRISLEDAESLFHLMKKVYPQAYDYFWEDSGNWYVNSQYCYENVRYELSQENAEYYFIIYNEKPVGNFRIIWNELLPEYPKKMNSVKLHRIYLDEITHGKGIGKLLLSWLEEEAKRRNYQLIWLDAMDEKKQAFSFYKKQGYQYHSHWFLPFDLLHDAYRKMSQLYKII